MLACRPNGPSLVWHSLNNDWRTKQENEHQSALGGNVREITQTIIFQLEELSLQHFFNIKENEDRAQRVMHKI